VSDHRSATIDFSLANKVFRMLASYGVQSLQASGGDDAELDRRVGKTTSCCELRVYESMSGECWKTTRRLVLSSTPDASEPWCISHCELRFTRLLASIVSTYGIHQGFLSVKFRCKLKIAQCL